MLGYAFCHAPFLYSCIRNFSIEMSRPCPGCVVIASAKRPGDGGPGTGRVQCVDSFLIGNKVALHDALA